jgi:hypothetical protein
MMIAPYSVQPLSFGGRILAALVGTLETLQGKKAKALDAQSGALRQPALVEPFDAPQRPF